MSSQIKTWYEFSQQQLVAESYLDDINFSDSNKLVEALVRGSNRQGFPETGLTRMTQKQAEAFVARYQIVDHYKNDSSGFSATLLFDTQTQQYTLSFRSTEYKNQSQGGDFERDGYYGADGEISSYGFAFAQLRSMQKYYDNLRKGIKSDGTVDPGLGAFFSAGNNN